MSGKPDFKPQTAHDWHVHYVYNDPDFISKAQPIKQAIKQPGGFEGAGDDIEELAQQFSISTHDVWLFLLPLYVQNRDKKTRLHVDLETGEYSIIFDPTITKAELLDEWERFEKIRTKLMPALVPKTKRKPPANPELVYAVFKARKHFKEKEVFEMYRTKTLPGYTGDNNQFDTYSELMRYYRTHKP